MTKVDELRGKIIDMAQGVSWNEMKAFLSLLDDYAAAAAEQEKEKMRKFAAVTAVAFDKNEMGYYIPASALAPAAKEADNGNS